MIGTCFSLFQGAGFYVIEIFFLKKKEKQLKSKIQKKKKKKKTSTQSSEQNLPHILQGCLPLNGFLFGFCLLSPS